MCGRFTLRTPPADVARQLDLPAMPPDVRERFNISPTQQVLALRNVANGRTAEGANPPREVVWLRWGLIPSWADDKPAGSPMINARSDSVTTKPTFRNAFRHRRCLVLADGFYEWQQRGKSRQPYYIHRPDGQAFVFAGLWERWSKSGEPIESCTLITTDANDALRPIHDRMPVILPREVWDLWLDPALDQPTPLVDVLRPAPEDLLVADPIGSYVNSARNEGPECIAAEKADSTLF